MILSKTPLRVSLFGGGSDYPEYLQAGNFGAVVGMAITKYQYVGVKRMPPGQIMEDGTPIKYRVQYSKVDDVTKAEDVKHPAVRAAIPYFGEDDVPMEFHIFGDLPGRSGLGGSSAFTVGLINSMSHFYDGGIEPYDLFEQATFLEQQIIKEAVGCQDQAFASFGGLRHFSFAQDEHGTLSIIPRLIEMHEERRVELESSLILVFTGTMRDAHVMAAKQTAVLLDKKSVIEKMVAMADDATALLTSGYPIDRIGGMLHESWLLKRSIHPEISSPAIDELYERGLGLGATGGKLLGAGGGGFMLFFVPIKQMSHFCYDIGMPTVQFQIANRGSHIIIKDY
jgi:D-glycero-alpha-D-manno-heptose-7-phosphate kinase